MKPTIGPETAPPIGLPALVMPTIVPASSRGNQLLMVLFVVLPIGPSPKPNSTRSTSREKKPVASAVAPQNSDHHAIATANTSRGPNRSAAQPPTKQKIE